jgi:SAM-dependent methyltransferase
MVDLGGGSGEVTSLLGWDPDRTVVLDGNPALIGHARGKLGLSGIRGGVDHIPLSDRSLEAVCLLDVLEHLDDPVATLQEARRVLAPSGRLIVHVPAHPWLWSTSDEQLGHRRRYTRRLLTHELADAGFEAVILTHVFSWLVPIMWLLRRVVRPATPETGLDHTALWIDRLALVLTGIERHLIGRLSLPIGASVLCVARPSPLVGQIDPPPH